ncbi:hypothetical protein OSTOST_06138, partial [Ostertagia ostertagi]
EELFDTPPSSLIVDVSGFSPEADSLPSTIDPTTDSCSSFLSSDFSDDEFSGEECRVPPLVRRFSNSLKVNGQLNELGSAAEKCSSATSLPPQYEEIDEFSE